MKTTRSPERAATVGLLGILVLAGPPKPLSAHPMGNFSISHYSALSIIPGEARLDYAIDMAEIPTFQERQKMDGDRDGQVTRAESDAYLHREQRRLTAGLSLRANGFPTPLAVRRAELAFAPGAGNLPTLKLRLRLAAPLSHRSGRLTLEYGDRNYPERTGWKELVVTGGSGARIVETNAPATSLSNALTFYPTDLLTAPPQQTAARVVVAVGAISEKGTARQSAGLTGQPRAEGPSSKRFATQFTELLTARRLSWPLLLLSLLVAFGLGAAHALEPGHGKTVVAAYLVGSRGTPKHALWLGLIVTFTHTAGVFALGLLTLLASAYVVPDRLYPWMGTLSGLAIAAVGLALLWRHGRHAYAHARGLTHSHGHGHGPEHDHDHDHSDGHNPDHVHSGHAHTHHSHGHREHGHDHTDPAHGHSHGGHGHHPHHEYDRLLEGRGIRFGTLLALGVSGGIVPCPGALVVLLGAVAMHRIGYGLALIAAFSLGLAAVLTGIGLLMVSARGLLDRVPGLSDGRWSERLALASATVVSALGIGIALQSLAAAGVLRIPV
jgi:nickel/cobalt exporter